MNPKQQTPVNRNAKHMLTEDEIKQYNEQLLAALQAKKEIEAEKKEVAATYKNKIAEQELAIDKISNLMRVGYEIRPFSCYLVKNFDSGKREFFEFGTDRLVDTEPLNAGDYQLQIEQEEAVISKNDSATISNATEPTTSTVKAEDIDDNPVAFTNEPELLGETIVESEEEIELGEAEPFPAVDEIEPIREEVEEDDPFGVDDDKGDFDFDDFK